MGWQVIVVLYVLVMLTAIVGVDLLFRFPFWERLTVNISIVMLFATFYLTFLKTP